MSGGTGLRRGGRALDDMKLDFAGGRPMTPLFEGFLAKYGWILIGITFGFAAKYALLLKRGVPVRARLILPISFSCPWCC